MSDRAMAAIGSREAVMAFRALGVEVYEAEGPEEGKRALFEAAQDGCAVILITEDMAAQIPEAISRYDSQPTPAIIPIPGARGSLGLGLKRVNANIEKAVGSALKMES